MRNLYPKNKYHNIKTMVDGRFFSSKKEANRYLILKAMAEAGKIKNLVLQPKYEIVVNGQKVCGYRADFSYDWNGRRITEDCKGMKTAVYSIKKRLMSAVLNIEITET